MARSATISFTALLSSATIAGGVPLGAKSPHHEPASKPGKPRSAIVAELNKAVNEIVADRAIEAKMVEEGADPAGGSPEKFAAFVRAEHEKWRVVVKESGASVD
jgi:hypothetical protein